MKIKIPDQLTAEIPQTFWGKMLTATPVVMTVIATALAGLASSEMTRAQYARSLAAQQQSKAADQWGFFQAKRLRGAMHRNTIDIIASTGDTRPLQADNLKTVLAGTGISQALDTPAGQLTWAALQDGQFPAIRERAPLPPKVEAALQAPPEIRVVASEDEVTAVLKAAQNQATELDDTLQPLNQTIDKIEKALLMIPGAEAVRRSFTVARLRYHAARYDAEARLNQAVAHIYELQVRASNQKAERHHRRSQRFFFGMLAAQGAVIISTFAIAARKRNVLWSIAAAAGVAAVSFAVYVYLFV